LEIHHLTLCPCLRIGAMRALEDGEFTAREHEVVARAAEIDERS
jgi:hypothetical protein